MRPESGAALRQILESAQEIQTVTAGKTLADYERERYLRAIVERYFITIGEALSCISRHEPGRLDSGSPGRIDAVCGPWPTSFSSGRDVAQPGSVLEWGSRASGRAKRRPASDQPVPKRAWSEATPDARASGGRVRIPPSRPMLTAIS